MGFEFLQFILTEITNNEGNNIFEQKLKTTRYQSFLLL